MPAITPELPPAVNHVFVDFENVHEIDLEIIGREKVSFTLFVGARQTQLDVSLVEKLFKHAVSVQLVRLTSPGRNALDFTLAYYIGRAVAADPTGRFHVVSKDGGYDPLLQHLRGRHIDARRHDSFATILSKAPAIPAPATPAPSTPKPKPQTKPKAKAANLDEWAGKVIERFRHPKANRPRTKTRLNRFLVAHLGKKITEADAVKLVEYLEKSGHLTIGENNRVSYQLKFA